jgi:hypothetical protein
MPCIERCTQCQSAIDPRDGKFACSHKACDADKLCIGCIWQCADCQQDFCESHIVDLKDQPEASRYSLYLCHPCLNRRRETLPEREAA